MGTGRAELRYDRRVVLLGGDLYTAYTFVAVPALVYGVGALGFFAVPYATIAYPSL